MEKWRQSIYQPHSLFLERKRTAQSRRLDPLLVAPLTKFDHKAFDQLFKSQANQHLRIRNLSLQSERVQETPKQLGLENIVYKLQKIRKLKNI
ncbi:unnamed protein product (macronuclear) [Paramecium tetraurelia]|uniref:Uncharacterized protein n=1 Tax=Paramecium tetraurelia TaxID=5888 RepID=A0EFD3_PARTE|nr:uncharacterized protein GSPATT00026347001 [Paramecium tetraurelia]CAK94024.1 unnamed protein product [Paramecium tetraurelia]|eukprot:XP_001461397.1 hypothetical protein (macronuclear) [Paramecium tetraurelia strain d4-2]